MRHLDDGQIAELIDAAEAAGAAGDMADHLAVCGACRERVEEARQIADRARSILATAVPARTAGTAVPAFEEVLHRAGRARRGGPGGLRWLAWAATVAVAGGLGWYARGELVRSAGRGPAVVATQPAREADAFRPADEERATNPMDVGRVGNEGAGAAPPPEPAAARPTESPAPRQEAGAADRLAGGRRDIPEQAKAAAPPAPAAPTPLPPAVSADSARERLFLRRSVVEAEQAPAFGAVAQSRAIPTPLDKIVLSREAAERVVGGPLAALDGLPIEVYYQLAAEPGVIRTEQTLPRGGKLELEQWRANTPRSVDDLRAGITPGITSRAARERAAVAADSLEVDGLKIIVRAPISADSLRALLTRIRR